MVAATFFSFKEFIIPGRTSNVYFAKSVLTEKYLSNKIGSLPCLKNYVYVYEWMDEKICFRIH